MSERVVGDGIYVRCQQCLRLALLPYVDDDRNRVFISEVIGWQVGLDQQLRCDGCARDPADTVINGPPPARWWKIKPQENMNG